MIIKDFIYIDTPKAISLYSQITGGIVELREVMVADNFSQDNKRRYDFKVFKHNAGGTTGGTEERKEQVKPHHSLFNELEDEMEKQGFLLTISQSDSLSDPILRSQLKQTMCVKITGRAVVEDYKRLDGIAKVWPQIVNFVAESQKSSLRESEEYVKAQSQIEQSEIEIRTIKDRNLRNKQKQQLATQKKDLEKVVTSADVVGGVDQWILDGLQTWISAFQPEITNIRMYHNKDIPNEHIFGHLKRASFEDQDSSSFHFTYGSMPTEELTLIGIVTSVPESEEQQFDPLSEFGDESSDDETVEGGFRGVFRGFDGMEQMIRTCRFPRVLVYPLLVYRSFNGGDV